MTWAQVHAFSQGLDLVLPSEDPEPSFNVAPTDPSWVLAAEAPRRALGLQMRWGLLPPWARDARVGASMINARLETVASKPAFRSAWKSRRCLVPGSGYYEWRAEAGIKQPYWVHDANAPLLMFAGLWENWKAPEGDWLQSFTILTRDADDNMRELHDRTPVTLDPAVLADWLHGTVEDATAIALSADSSRLVWHPVSRAVSNPRSSGRELIAPL